MSNLFKDCRLAIERRIYTTFILGTALQNFGTRANSFGHGPLYLHGKFYVRVFSMLISGTAPLKQERHSYICESIALI